MSRLDQSRVVEASAGTGKTTALVNRIPLCGPYEEHRAHEKSQAELRSLDLRGSR